MSPRTPPTSFPEKSSSASSCAICRRKSCGGWRNRSSAGHDAQSMALLGPMAMIFVPSVDGISHSPRELTRWEDCARGADVLLQCVLRAAG
ncbi:MAG: M20/M25/M40 family metallo-hydrolase [Acidobacteria bacterium]|nr:M20/M25/M40 family metallo-hydrolase [Acidobacteriota bacterium]